MLCLTRSVGESLLIGDAITVTVAAIHRGAVWFNVTQGGLVKAHKVHVDRSLRLADDIVLHVRPSRRPTQTALGIAAPKDVLIMRAEILTRSKEPARACA